MAITSTTSNHEDAAMAAILGQDEDAAGADLLLPEKQRVHPISTKVAQLLLDLLVLAAPRPSSSSLGFSCRAGFHPSPSPSLNYFSVASNKAFLDNEAVDDEESFAFRVRPWLLFRRSGSGSFKVDDCLVPGSWPHDLCFSLFVAVDVGGWAASFARLPAQLGDAADVLCGGGGRDSCGMASMVAVKNQAMPLCSIKQVPPSDPWGPLHQSGGHVLNINKEPPRSLKSTSRGPRQGLAMKLHLVVVSLFTLAAITDNNCPSAGSFLHPFLFSCRAMHALQPLVLLFYVLIGQLLLRGWFGDSASPWVFGASFFYLWRRHPQYPSIVGILLLQQLLRPTLNRRFAQSVHLGARVLDASAYTPRQQNRSPLRLSQRCSLLFRSQDLDVTGSSLEDLYVI